MDRPVAGVDIGTTSLKAVVFGKEAEVLGAHAVDYPLYAPEPGAAEQDPEQIYGAVEEGLSHAVKRSGLHPGDIACVCLSAAMHSVLAVDRRGRPLTRALTYADTRSTEQVREIRASGEAHALYTRTGTPVHPMSPLPKLRWLAAKRPREFGEAHKFVSLKEYVLNRLFDEFVVDHSIASATGLLDLSRLEWDPQALRAAGVEAERLSAPVPAGTVMTGLDRRTARRLNLDTETPFVVGASDGCLATLGSGAIFPGRLSVTIGTSGALRTVVRAPVTDPLERTFCYALTNDHWVVGGPISNGGIVLRWFREQLGGAEAAVAESTERDPYDVMTELAATVPPGSGGLQFMPFITGERAPSWDPHARGVLFGLALEHTRAHIIRALLEGVVLSLHSVDEAVRDIAEETDEIRASGGFTKSRLWRQILADVFERRVRSLPLGYEASCLGAAVLGAVAVGELDAIEDVEDLVEVEEELDPDPAAAGVYRRVKKAYARLSEGFGPLFPVISELQESLPGGARQLPPE
jgi:gluconokinase